jgi:hypothetical protein
VAPGATYKSFTAALTDVITSPAHGFVDTDPVYVLGDSLPTGIAEGTEYFVRDVTTDTFKLAATSGGAAIDLTTVGSGTVVKALKKTIGINDQLKLAAGSIVVQLR